ncbi:hypothetical protein BU23DRAFT_292826 [Bimuria novae-zelandiae CBS 107.79]|uniref:BZIP domain-containing protein n=1 Tax=Bimuria novae-zelandiae CBS 107.79 TaxID=1447943 RepID=A0A6A5V1U3_9PLEO|nr:hypothetical protein BU23DRAFT_292826 [Bimuria novae-zelandiae CBS 107.79]
MALQQPSDAPAEAIIPTPNASFTPITTAAPPVGASPLSAGPTSSNYVVPPRPKPGRKPATDEPASKRKAQNRESQRAFRARKAAKIQEMQEQADTTNRKHREELNEMLSEKHRLLADLSSVQGQLEEARQALERATKERDYWKERSTHMDAQLVQTRLRETSYPLNPYNEQQPVYFPQPHSPTRSFMGSFSGYSSPKSMNMGCGSCKPGGECACITEFCQTPNPFTAPVPTIQAPPRKASTPMKAMSFQNLDPFADREIDFTAQFSSKRRQEPAVSLMGQGSSESDAKCGFCTDGSNCLCRDQSLQFQDDLVSASNGAKINAPGSCDACQSNPKQRAWCQRVAQLKTDGFLPPPGSRTSSISSALDTMEPHIPDASTPYGAKSSIGCNEAFKLLDGRVPMDADKMDWISTLRQVSSQARRDAMMHGYSRNYSAIELDTAGIIATLGNTLKPIQPRQEDGENADIVRIAQEYQRQTQSPHTSPEYAT